MIQGRLRPSIFLRRGTIPELLHGGPIAEILKEGGDGHARAAKDPGPANFVRVSFDSLTRFQSFMLSSLFRRVRCDGAGQTADARRAEEVAAHGFFVC